MNLDANVAVLLVHLAEEAREVALDALGSTRLGLRPRLRVLHHALDHHAHAAVRVHIAAAHAAGVDGVALSSSVRRCS